MKFSVILSLITFIACGQGGAESVQVKNASQKPAEQESIQEKKAPQKKSEDFITASIKGFAFKLRSDNGRCILSYRNERNREQDKDEKDLVLDLDAPCEFVRQRESGVPKSYSYEEKAKEARKFDVIIIPGGPPNPDRKDNLMPGGCGTEFQAVNIFADEVMLGLKLGREKRVDIGCPSGGLDEIYFAEYSGIRSRRIVDR